MVKFYFKQVYKHKSRVYKINLRSKRRFIETVGFLIIYKNSYRLMLDLKKFNYWFSVGAQLNASMRYLMQIYKLI